jgi:1-acyl-sn-glycerol-3-phosphate acyltransferase
MIYPAVRRLLSPVCRAIYRIEVRGEEHVPADGPVVVAANHPSVLDPFVLSTAIERPLRYLAKAELWRVPFCAPLLDALGGIAVNRDMGDRAALAVALAVLEQGDAVGIFPQGGVRRDTWHRGAARLALASGSPLVPVRILATDEALRPGHIGFPRVAILIGEPIPVERRQPTIAIAAELTVRLQTAVEALGS